jgi:hypothetical protein
MPHNISGMVFGVKSNPERAIKFIKPKNVFYFIQNSMRYSFIEQEIINLVFYEYVPQ